MAKAVAKSSGLSAAELRRRISKLPRAVVLRRIVTGERLMAKLLKRHFECRIEALEKKIKKLEARA